MLLASYDTPMNPYGPAIDQLRPYKGTLSGEKEWQKPSYNNGPPSSKYPILALEDNIIDDSGKGLKKGFYEIRISENKDFLLFVQSGVIKAKVPVVFYESYKKKEVKQNLSDKEVAKKMKKEAKEAKEDAYKYRRGENPKDIVFNDIKMYFDDKNSCWVIIWEADEQKAIGCFRI